MRRMLLLSVILAAGCVGKQSLTSWFQGEPAATREANLAAAARVDQVGRKILAANPLSGVGATFQVIGHEDSILFHRDRAGVFISDTLVEQCKTDAELAAVLCTELGKMVAEERNLARMGYSEPFAQVPTENTRDGSNLAADPVRLTEAAIHERGGDRKLFQDVKKELNDPEKIAGELMTGVGYDAAALATVEPILKGANRNRSLLQQLGSGGSAPTWSR